MICKECKFWRYFEGRNLYGPFTFGQCDKGVSDNRGSGGTTHERFGCILFESRVAVVAQPLPPSATGQ